jgi:choice-of-anchor B domain-containing protein
MKNSVFLFLFIITNYCAFGQKNITLLSHKPYPMQLSNVWGITNDGQQYALVGTKYGLSIVDINDPTNPNELYELTADSSIWREVKTWNHFVYTSTEGGGGVLIVDIANLPGSINHHHWQGSDGSVNRVHSLHVDEFGYLYLYGGDYGNRGCRIFDLNADPMNPTYVGEYQAKYIHDGEVRNNIMYASHIIDGELAIVDVSNKANPVLMGITTTPSQRTHNTWLSDNDSICYTTDEATGGFVCAYKVCDAANIEELDRWQSYNGAVSMPHNVIVKNDFLIVSYYKEGVFIVDAHKPDNLVTVGYYDTSPLTASPGATGCWGAYPFPNNNLIIATDMQAGMFVLEANYQRASYLEGNVRDSAGNSIIGATCSIVGTLEAAVSSLSGEYKMGIADSGMYDIEIISADCGSKIIPNVHLRNGEVEILNVIMPCGTPTSIDDNTINAIITYDNNNEIINIENIENRNYHKTIQLINATGAIVTSINNENRTTQINCKNYPSGLYFVEVKTNKNRLIKKIILQ